MQEKHPIDELFKDGLTDPDILFNEKDWRRLSKKLRGNRKRTIPLWVWAGSAAAAAIVLAIMLFVTNRNTRSTIAESPGYTQKTPAEAPPSSGVQRHSAVSPGNGLADKPAVDDENRSKAIPPPVGRMQAAATDSQGSPALSAAKTTYALLSSPTATASLTPRTDSLYNTSIIRPAHTMIGPPDARMQQPRYRVAGPPQRGWAFSILAAPDLSGTQPLGGKLSGNIGLIATYRLSNRFTISTGALYARKRYAADFADYRPSATWNNSAGSPSFVEADCGVLDIPFNIGVNVSQSAKSSWFVSAGISSYLMLRETYNYSYPPHEYGYPQQITLHNQNRHMLGIGNLSVGYGRKLTPSLSVTVQPFVKVPLTGIGNGNLKLYSSGIAISADIDLTRRRKP
ncbi:outer membrane beta-barrel protein [Parapedobacter sp. ISTM3]|uniref:outer membrane beta-barrel protein n=1 Tax=Parapedobacter sp. ISTM3 TaxID=2800130 RepID=UPI001906FA7B|nr:outer membrane beta-barrel protein [Parapedobacter sp. ISTM3]MBK1440177.1 outer membrane beta-barrel protein [Parapedobacter sp. ISTM3]